MGILETRKAASDSYRLLRNLGTRVQAASAFRDENLSPQGLENARAEQMAKSRDAAAWKAQRLLKTAQDGLTFAESKVASHRPHVDPENIAQLTRSAQAWQMTVKPMLDQGKTWFDIMKVADVDTIMAIGRFAEQTIRANETESDAAAILSNLQSAADRRLAEVHPDADVRTAFAEATEARDLTNIVQTIAGSVDGIRNPATAASAMIGAKHRLHPTGLIPEGPAPTAETLDYQVATAPHAETTIP